MDPRRFQLSVKEMQRKTPRKPSAVGVFELILRILLIFLKGGKYSDCQLSPCSHSNL